MNLNAHACLHPTSSGSFFLPLFQGHCNFVAGFADANGGEKEVCGSKLKAGEGADA